MGTGTRARKRLMTSLNGNLVDAQRRLTVMASVVAVIDGWMSIGSGWTVDDFSGFNNSGFINAFNQAACSMVMIWILLMLFVLRRRRCT